MWASSFSYWTQKTINFNHHVLLLLFCCVSGKVKNDHVLLGWWLCTTWQRGLHTTSIFCMLGVILGRDGFRGGGSQRTKFWPFFPIVFKIFSNFFQDFVKFFPFFSRFFQFFQVDPNKKNPGSTPDSRYKMEWTLSCE